MSGVDCATRRCAGGRSLAGDIEGEETVVPCARTRSQPVTRHRHCWQRGHNRTTTGAPAAALSMLWRGTSALTGDLVASGSSWLPGPLSDKQGPASVLGASRVAARALGACRPEKAVVKIWGSKDAASWDELSVIVASPVCKCKGANAQGRLARPEPGGQSGRKGGSDRILLSLTERARRRVQAAPTTARSVRLSPATAVLAAQH